MVLRLANGKIVNADGTITDPKAEAEQEATRKANEDLLIKVAAENVARSLEVTVQRKLADMPAEPRVMNTVAVVLSYTLFGVSVAEIAVATGMTEEQVKSICAHDAYGKMRETIIQTIVNAETDNVRDMITSHSRHAAKSLVDTLLTTKSEANRIVVAKDILDRAGHRPADVVEHRHKMDGGLTIEIIHKDKRNEMPVIDLEVETVQ